MEYLKLNLARKPSWRDRWIMISCLVLALVLLVTAFMATRRYSEVKELVAEQERRLSQATQKRQELDKKVSEAKRQAASQGTGADAAVIGELLAKRPFSWVALLGELERTAPTAVSLSGISFKPGEGKLQLTGLARDLKGVTEFINSLGEKFNQVFLVSQKRATADERRALGGEATLFEISLGVETPGPGEAAESPKEGK